MSKDDLCQRIATQLPEALGFALLEASGAGWLGRHAIEGDFDDGLRAALSELVRGEATAALLAATARLHGLPAPTEPDGDALLVLGPRSAFARRVGAAWAVALMRTESSLGKGWGALARAVQLLPPGEIG